MVSLNDIFYQGNITTINKVESNDNVIDDLFKNRFILNRDKISDLSLNAKFYYPSNNQDEFDLDIFDDYTEKFQKLIWNENINIIYLFGPKGTSKSIFLMNFCLIHYAEENPMLYINYKVLNNLLLKTRKYYFKREMVYLFFDIDKFRDFYNSKYHRKIENKENNLIHNLKEFTQELINIYENTFEKKITIIIDNFEENNNIIFSELDQLIELVNKNSTKLRLIISGHSNFLTKKFEFFLKNKSFSDIIKNQALFIYNLKLKSNDEIKSLAAFHFRKEAKDKEFENILIKEEIQYCQKFNLYGLHYSIINNGKDIELEKLLNYLHILPCEYLLFSINNNNTITFNYYNPIFLNAAKKSIKAEIKGKSLQFLISEDNKDFLINGIYEEKLLAHLLLTIN